MNKCIWDAAALYVHAYDRLQDQWEQKEEKETWPGEAAQERQKQKEPSQELQCSLVFQCTLVSTTLQFALLKQILNHAGMHV